MRRLPLIAAALALTAAAATAACAQANARDILKPIDDIEWSYRAADGRADGPLLRLTREGMNSMFDPSDLPQVMDALTASVGRPGQDIAFSLVREAGALACAGRSTGQGRAAGTCRFDPGDEFVRALAARDLHPEDVEQTLALALVDARLALVDGLSREGFRVEDVDQLIAVTALDVSDAFVAELRGAGLVTSDIDDLIAARGVEIDAAWVREMAEAGYPDLGMEKAIQMRALGVTPEYARRMARVMDATEGAE